MFRKPVLPFLLGVGLVAITALAASGGDEAATPPGTESGLLAGVYTAEQADRGEAVITGHCASCHGATLTGGQFGGPPLRGSFFFDRWAGKTLEELYVFVRLNMPAGRPNSLTAQQYIDSIAFILETNEFPAGEEELPPDRETLAQLEIVAP